MSQNGLPFTLRFTIGVGALGIALVFVTMTSGSIAPVQWAVFIGVVLFALVYFFTAADDVKVVELLPTGDRQIHIVEEMLPSVRQARYPVVILSLLGHDQIIGISS